MVYKVLYNQTQIQQNSFSITAFHIANKTTTNFIHISNKEK